MNNQDRTISALLDLIDRLEHDLDMVGQENVVLKAEMERAHEARRAAQNKLNQLCADDLDGGAFRDMQREFDA